MEGLRIFQRLPRLARKACWNGSFWRRRILMPGSFTASTVELAKRAVPPSRAPGAYKSSVLRKPIISPWASFKPLLSASYMPLSGSLTTFRWGNCANKSNVPSVGTTVNDDMLNREIVLLDNTFNSLANHIDPVEGRSDDRDQSRILSQREYPKFRQNMNINN